MAILPPLLLLFAAGSPPARAQERRLADLERARNQARDAHHDTIVKITLLRQQLRQEDAKLARETKAVRALQSQEAGVLRNAQLQAARREQNRTSARCANLKVQLRATEDGRRVRRLKLIQASWAWVARLLETADRAWSIGRRKQAQEYTDLSLAELARLEDLESLEDPPEQEFQPGPLDPRAPTAELRELADLYDALLEGVRGQSKDLAPVEQKLQSRVRHLDRLVLHAYAVPTLDQRLRRAQGDLQRVAGLRQSAEQRALRYRRELDAIDALLASRGLERQRSGRSGGE